MKNKADTENNGKAMIDKAKVGMTLNYVLDSSCDKYGSLKALGMAMKYAITYAELHEKVLAMAHYLHQEKGIKKGDRIGILAENSDRWGPVYLAVVRLGGIAVPMLPDLPESDVHHILNEMKVKALFTTQRQIDKVYELKNIMKCPVITLDDYQGEIGLLKISTFTDFIGQAMEKWHKDTEKGGITFPDVGEDDLAAILYTSGTSGYSKAVLLSHKNLTANAYSAASLMEIPPGSVFLSILPLSHTYEFTCGFILPLLTGCKIAYVGKAPTPAILQKFCQHEKPFAIFAVPLVMEKIYKKRILPKIEESFILSLISKFGTGRKFIHRRSGVKLMDFFGGNLKLMGIGGAALNPEVENFLDEADFPYLIGYGMTESSPLLAGGPMGDETIVVGSTGKPIPGVEIRIEDADPETGVGEIYACGPNITSGYHNDKEATAEALTEDGWLITGDLGMLDEYGNLHIKGRSKNVIVMANGENVYPEAIEHKINTFSWVVESLVYEKDNNIEALVYPDYEIIDELTKGKNRTRRAEIIASMLEEMRKELNSQISKAARVTKVYERREPFIKTATHKIKRYLYV